jgi:hypothetical protein
MDAPPVPGQQVAIEIPIVRYMNVTPYDSHDNSRKIGLFSNVSRFDF